MIDPGVVNEKKAAVAAAEDMPPVTMVTDDGRDHGGFQYEHETVTTTVTVIESLFVITDMTATLDEATHQIAEVGVARLPEDMTGNENGIGIGIGIVSVIWTEIDAGIEALRGTLAFVIDDGHQIEIGICAIGIAVENETVTGSGTETVDRNVKGGEIALTINVAEATILALALVPGKETVSVRDPETEFVKGPAKDLEIEIVTVEIGTVNAL